MKAASSEWYNTTARHVLPTSLSSSQRLFEGKGRYDASYSTASTSSRSYTSSSLPQHRSSSSQRSISLLSSSKHSRSTPTTYSSSFSSFSRSRSRSSSTTEPTTFSTSSTTTSALSGVNKYKQGHGSKLFHTRSTPIPPRHSTATDFTEVSETEVTCTEEEEDEDEEGYSGSAHVPTDEASSADECQEEEDDDKVYHSFKESLRMLRATGDTRSRSSSPAISTQSVVTDLEEDEEDLPPDEVDDELPTTTEEDDEEDETETATVTGGYTTTTSSSSRSGHVPKSPVKVRVKVEKTVPHDDRVKVTVSLDESESDEEEEEEDDDDDVSDDTTNTAETVQHRRTTEGESYEEGEDSTDHDDGGSDSDVTTDLEKPPGKKTDQDIFRDWLRREGRNVNSLSDLPMTSIARGGPSRSQTVHDIRHRENKPPQQPSSSRSIISTAAAVVPSSSSPSETSSRSHSARSSLVRKVSAIHKMYSVGGKLRSLSARKPGFLLEPTAAPAQIQLSVESPTPEGSSATASNKTSSSGTPGESEMSTGTHSRDSSAATLDMAKYGRLAPPGKLPLILHHSRSLSAKYSARDRQFSAALRQLSLGNLKKLHESGAPSEFPPIAPASPASSSSSPTTQGRTTTRPRPLLRTLTYLVSSEDSASPMTQSSSNLFLSQLSSEMSTTHLSQSALSSSSSRSKARWSSTARSSSQQSLSDVVSKAKSPSNKHLTQVSFANEVIEHSLSTNRTKSTSEHNGSSSQGSSQTGSGSEGSESEEEASQANKKKVDAINRRLITYGDLEEESVEELTESEHQIKQLAADQMRREIRRMERQRSSEVSMELELDDEDEEDDDEDETEGSDEDEVTTADRIADETAISEVPAQDEPTAVTEMAHESPLPQIPAEEQIVEEGIAPETKEDEVVDAQVEEKPKIINKSDDSLGWHEAMSFNFEDDSPPGSRLLSASSGYRAVPPTPASSKDYASRQASLDSEDMEKEKDKLMAEWQKDGGKSKPPTVPGKGPLDASSRLPGVTEEMTFPGFEGSSRAVLIQGDIDLTQELPNEEKRLQSVWEEFNRDDRNTSAMAEYEFSNILEEMVQDVNNYRARHSNGGSGPNSNNNSQSLQVSNQMVSNSSYEVPKFDPSRRYQSLSQMVALLSHNLRMITAETMEDHMASIITMISSILRKVRRNKQEDDYNAQIACLSAIRVLCDRLQEMHSSHNLKYADLSWLFRILCKYSSDSESKIRPEASFCLARLVKVAGPALVVRPIYFILVMESEGGGGKAATGAKTKAAAIDTLTYALLTFPKEGFHNLEEIAGWVCLSMLNEERRIRQSALECLAVISQHLGRDKALPLFRTLFLREEMDHFSRSPSPDSFRGGKGGKGKGKGGDGGAVSVHGTVRLLTGPGFPMAQPIDAIIARLDKDILPVPSTKGLIEYAVNVPTGKDLVLLMTHMLEKEDDMFDFTSSSDSADSASFQASASASKRSSVSSLGFSDIDWNGEGVVKEKKSSKSDDLITADVAFILLGKGKVNKQEVVLLDIYKREILPELLEKLDKRMGRTKNKRNRWKKQQFQGRRRRKNKKKGPEDENNPNGRPSIPTLSFDMDDHTKEPDDNVDDNEGDEITEAVDHDNGGGDDVFDNEEESPVAVVVDAPPSEEVVAYFTGSTSVDDELASVIK